MRLNPPPMFHRTSAKSFDGQQGENETFRREPTKMNAQASEPSNLPKKSSLPGVSGNRQKPSPAGPRKMAYSHQFVRSALGSSDEGRIDPSVYSLLKRFPFAGSICPPTTRNKNRHAFGGMHEAQRRGIPHLIERL